MTLRQLAQQFFPPLLLEAIRRLKGRKAQSVVQTYLEGGRVPWSPGYSLYKGQFIRQALANSTLLEHFRREKRLEPGYGVGIDERCIEYPWFLSHLHPGAGALFDAGSALNHQDILDHPLLQGKVLHILTLAPEANCFWQKSISYLFHDLRDIPVRDDYYDTIACLSTLEHVGCDNTAYTLGDVHRERSPEAYLLVMQELRRVLKPGGSLYVTLPFGVYRHFGTFQQFDRRLLSRAVEAFGKTSRVTEHFYRYTAEGWNRASWAECAACEYVEWITQPSDRWPRSLPVEQDLAAAARAVACVQLVKG